jgi:four helix bundle protein
MANEKICKFEDLRAWIEARRLVRTIYDATNASRFSSDRNLAVQIRSAAISVMANIAEGFDSGSEPEFRRFISFSRRSLSEVESHLYAALDQKYLPGIQFDRIYAHAESLRKILAEVDNNWASFFRNSG